MGLPVAEQPVQPVDDAIEVGGAKFAEAVVAPVAVHEPGVDLGEVRDLGLEE